MLNAAVDGSYVDPGNARLIVGAAVALVVLAVGLAAGTAWWWIRARPEHPALAPLEEMSSRRWRSTNATTAVPVRGERSLVPPVPADPLLWRSDTD